VGCHQRKINSLGNASSKQEKVPLVGNNEKKNKSSSYVTPTKIIII
jgi:hypothetical protein